MNRIRQVDKPWGFEIWWAHTEAYAGKLLHVERGHRLSLQYHRHKDESCYLLSGRVRLVKGPSLDELAETELTPGACWRNLPGEIHTVDAVETSLLIEASTPHLDDVVRLLDDYGRAQPERATAGGNAVAAEIPAVARPARLLDRDQLAVKLSLRRSELSEFLRTSGFPPPSAYFRGRMLWEEALVDAWQLGPVEVSDLVRVARAKDTRIAAES